VDVIGDSETIMQLAAEDGGSFLVSPNLGLMIWTLLAFGTTLYILNKVAFPRIAEALDRRRKAIEDSIESAERTRREADELLEEYRARLKEAREQAEDIVVRARKAATKQREELLTAAKRDIEAETRRSLEEIRKEVANLTLIATEKVTRKSLTPDDHRRLIEDALREVDFSTLSGRGNAR
jgi:F-type H+-transporting ATPase subunit b